MSAEDCRIVRQEQEAARAAYLRRIDREVRHGLYADLSQRGQAASAVHKAERHAHRITIERGAGLDSYRRYGFVGDYHAACSCGWQGRPVSSRRLAEKDLQTEREYIATDFQRGPATMTVSKAPPALRTHAGDAQSRTE